MGGGDAGETDTANGLWGSREHLKDMETTVLSRGCVILQGLWNPYKDSILAVTPGDTHQ